MPGRSGDSQWVQGWLEGRVDYPAPSNDQMVHIEHGQHSYAATTQPTVGPPHRREVTTVGFSHGSGPWYGSTLNAQNSNAVNAAKAHHDEATIRSIQQNRERFVYGQSQYAVQDPIDAMPDSRVKSELHRMGINTAHQSAAGRRSQLRLLSSDHPTARTTRVPPSLSSSAMTGAVAYGHSKAHIDEKGFTSDGFTIVDDRHDELHPDVHKIQHELRVIQAANLELNQDNYKLKQKQEKAASLTGQINDLRAEKALLKDKHSSEKIALYKEFQNQQGTQASGLSDAETKKLRDEAAAMKAERDAHQLQKVAAEAKLLEVKEKKRAADSAAATVAADLSEQLEENDRLRSQQAQQSQGSDSADMQARIVALEQERDAARAANTTASGSNNESKLKQDIANLENEVHQLKSAGLTSAPELGDYMQADLKTLGLNPNEYGFGKRVYQCQISSPGVGYRNTPSFPDKVPDGTGPQAPECIIATAMVQGPKAIFVKCSSGKGWLPLTDPNGSRICFKMLGTEDEVDFEKHDLKLADGSTKFSPKKKVDWYKKSPQ